MVTIEKFYNIKEFADALQARPQTSKGKYYNHSTDNDEYFSGTKSYDEADTLFRFGDKENADKIKDVRVNLKIKGGGYERKSGIYNSQNGFTPNIGAYITGHPCNMINTRTTLRTSSKVITIVYDVTVSYHISTSSIIENAVNVFETVKMMEAKGYRINLYVSAVLMDKSNNVAGVKIKLKDSGKPLDVLRMAYPMLHPSFIRRHFIAYMERVPTRKYKLYKSVGKVINERAERYLCEKGEKYLSFYKCTGKSVQQIAELLTN